MAWYRAGGGGIPSAIKTDMNVVLNKKFGTSTDYPPTDWATSVNLLGPLPEKTVSGAIANFSDGADRVPIKSWNVTVDANLDGVSSIEVTQAGKNLFNKNDSSSIVVGSFSSSGYSTSGTGARTVYVPIKGGATYTVSKMAGKRFSVATSDVPPTDGATFTSKQDNHQGTEITITAGVSDKYLWAWVYLQGEDTSTLADILASIQIEVGSSASTYSAYEATTVTAVPLGRTIYGGTADVVNGTGTDYGVKETVSSSYLSGLSSSYIGYSSSVSAMNNHPCVWVRNFGYPTANEFVVGGIKCACNHFPVTMNNSQIISTQYRIYFDVDGKNISSVQDFIDYVSALENNNDSLEVVYQKSSPDDFTFDPMTPTPETSLGVNNFWADEGDSEVTYRADISLLLNSLQNNRGLMMMRPVNTEEIEFEEGE